MSKTGVHVVPALVVFQTPPEAAARYQVSGRSGLTAISETRPDIVAGPMPRRVSPSNVEACSTPFPFSAFWAATVASRESATMKPTATFGETRI